jgi:hypothetical protein
MHEDETLTSSEDWDGRKGDAADASALVPEPTKVDYSQSGGLVHRLATLNCSVVITSYHVDFRIGLSHFFIWRCPLRNRIIS